MAGSPLSLRLGLAGACGLLLVGGIAGAATVDGGKDEAPPTGEALASNDTIAPGATGDGAAQGVAPVPGAADAPTTSIAPAGEATTTTAGGAVAAATTTTRARSGGSGTPGPLVAPKPGAYAYENTTTSASGTTTDRSTTTVEAAGTEGATTIQAVTIALALGSQQAVARNTVAWSTAGGAVVRRSLITVSGLGQLDCTWQPAFAQYAGGLAVGAAWSFDTRCAGKVQGIDATIQQRAARKVTGTAQIAAPGGTVPTWTIADDTTIVVTTPFGPTTVRTVGTQQLAPSLGLPVRTESTIESRMGASAPDSSKVVTKLVARP